MTPDPTAEPAAAPPARRSGPLAGVRVLDLTAVVLGPLATQILGDWGADVIKVEPPEGDLMRANGVSTVRGMSSIFLAINRNKRSLAVDLKQPAGVDVIKRLLPTVDVLVHNMRTAAIERLGLGYAACAAINPKLLYCVATGFGESGPDAGRPAFDDGRRLVVDDRVAGAAHQPWVIDTGLWDGDPVEGAERRLAVAEAVIDG